jgi:hypothetical protein
MITCGAVPAPLPAHIGVSQISPITASQDFADTLAPARRPLAQDFTRLWVSARQGVFGKG